MQPQLSEKQIAQLNEYAQRHGQAALDELLAGALEERKRMELLAAFDEAEADLEAGRYTEHTGDTSSQLADALKREARAERESQRSA